MGENLNHYKEVYRENTGDASKINRNLALAGIGVIWIFRSGTDATGTIPAELALPLLVLLISLSLDFLQYLVAGFIWFRFFKAKEKQGVTDDIDSHTWRANTIHTFYVLKIVAMIVAYILLFKFLYSVIGTQ
ncbi:MAG: hypothetical protein IH948_10295 [Bacteroidetes bacterium]|nr:hypothetical protein [Bacteroidota bacterium]